MTKTRVATALLLAFALPLVGCGGADDKDSDPDDRRDKAKPLPLNKVFTDSIANNGDRSDWKIFFVEAPGLLKVTIRLKDVEQLFCTSPNGGAITYADLTAPTPVLEEVSLADVEKVNRVVARIIR